MHHGEGLSAHPAQVLHGWARERGTCAGPLHQRCWHLWVSVAAANTSLLRHGIVRVQPHSSNGPKLGSCSKSICNDLKNGELQATMKEEGRVGKENLVSSVIISACLFHLTSHLKWDFRTLYNAKLRGLVGTVALQHNGLIRGRNRCKHVCFPL